MWRRAGTTSATLLQAGRAAAGDRRAGRAGAARRRGGRLARGASRRSARRGQGRLERLLGAAHRGRARRRRSISASCRARAACSASRWRRRRARRRCSCSAPTRSTSRPAPSWSISAPTATAARIAPTSSCRAPPTPEKSGIYVNTEGRVQMAARAVVPARRGARGLGDPARAVGRARHNAALRLRWRSCARRCSRRIRILQRIDRSRRGDAADIADARRRSAACRDKAPFRRPVDGLLPDQSRSRAPPPSWPSAPRSPRGASRARRSRRDGPNSGPIYLWPVDRHRRAERAAAGRCC